MLAFRFKNPKGYKVWVTERTLKSGLDKDEYIAFLKDCNMVTQKWTRAKVKKFLELKDMYLEAQGRKKAADKKKEEKKNVKTKNRTTEKPVK